MVSHDAGRRRPLRRQVNPVLCLMAVLAGCARESRTGVTVTDSAGVRITVTREADTTFADIDPQPVLDLGGLDVSGPTQFSRIAGVYADARGNVWVADGGSAELRLFRPDGSHWKTRGGSGEGPGEFRRLRLLGAFRGDSVACWDDGLGRLTVFDGEGELARTARVPPGEEAVPRGHAIFPDGTLLVQFPRVFAGGSLEPGQLLGDTAHLERLDLETANRDPLASVPGPRWVWTGHSQVPLPFTVNPGFDLDREAALHLVAGPEFRIRVFRPGLTESYGVARNPRPVTSQVVTAYARFMAEALPQPERGEYLAVLDHPARPQSLPAYTHVVVADDGKVWAQIYSPEAFGAASWDLFDTQRRWVGQVQTPAGLTVSQVAGTSLLGVWRDTLGVEYVRIYRMRPR